jgi:hypothetical protein
MVVLASAVSSDATPHSEPRLIRLDQWHKTVDGLGQFLMLVTNTAGEEIYLLLHHAMAATSRFSSDPPPKPSL